MEGFELTIHQSLTSAHLVMGIPRQLALVIYTLIGALTFPLGTWYAIPPGLFLHVILAAAAKKDPLFWDVFRRAFLIRAFYRS